MYFRNIGNVRNIYNLKSTKNKVCIKLIYMLKIIYTIDRRKHSSGYIAHNNYELLYVISTSLVCVANKDKGRQRGEF